jgi:Kae1-associated kinase Bud32
MKLIQKGAEADLFKDVFLGMPVIIKQRNPKKYRDATLDETIRLQRTKTEAVLLEKARKTSVHTPLVFNVDIQNTRLTLEYIQGKKMKDLLTGKYSAQKKQWCMQLGKDIALLHAANLIHGDLTTSNILIHNKQLTFIDFGLAFESNKQEDKAVDLLNLKKMFYATHFEALQGWEHILHAYMIASHNTFMPSKLQEIEARARYS